MYLPHGTRTRQVPFPVSSPGDGRKGRSIQQFVFLGTVISGVRRHRIPYNRPKTASYKRCCFNCSESFSNKTTVLRHHRPRQFDTKSHPCAHRLFHLRESGRILPRKKSNGCWRPGDMLSYISIGAGYRPFQNPAPAIGLSLLSFALKDLRQTDERMELKRGRILRRSISTSL